MLAAGEFHAEIPYLPDGTGLVGDGTGETLASARTAGVDIATATLGGHAGAESDLADTANLGWTVSWLHGDALNLRKGHFITSGRGCQGCS